jgi:4-alpha-glucanotransferase
VAGSVEKSALQSLAERAGILPTYVDSNGVARPTAAATRTMLLAALGFEADDEIVAARTLERLDEQAAVHVVDPVRVTPENGATLVPARSTQLSMGALRFRIVATDEATGETSERTGTAHVRADGTVVGLRTAKLSRGAHRLAIELDGPGGERAVEQWLFVVPHRCKTVNEAVGGRGAFGIWCNLYSVRGRAGHGIGNLSDLADLTELAARAGADFVGINPLHALRNHESEISPYGPVSRLFRNPLYISIADVPELAGCEEATEWMERDAFRRELESVRAAKRIDYERVANLQRPVLAALYRCFHRDGGERKAAYVRYAAEQGELLTDFATFMALEEERVAAGHPRDWREWPRELHDPRSAAVAEFRRAHADEIGFHAYVQFELDRQLAAAGAHARREGMAIGLYHDLAVGSLASGFDAWAFPGLFVDGVSLGAPPDAYCAGGQDWGLPPVNPHALAADGYRYWRLLLRAAMAHCGALRLDHSMGVLRQYWIPAGRPGTDGAYVHFPAHDLLGLAALESKTHGALVIGEDLGTVPRGFSSLLARYGILSSSVLLFERTARGSFRRAAAYSRRALATANTHDQPTLAGYWRGRDLEIRRQVGMIGDDAALHRARAEREVEKRALVRRLVRDGALLKPKTEPRIVELVAGVHAFLARTPAPLVGVSLDDLAGEIEPVNVPGVGPDGYPSWTRRMRLTVDELQSSDHVEQSLAAVAPRARRRKPV